VLGDPQVRFKLGQEPNRERGEGDSEPSSASAEVFPLPGPASAATRSSTAAAQASDQAPPPNTHGASPDHTVVHPGTAKVVVEQFDSSGPVSPVMQHAAPSSPFEDSPQPHSSREEAKAPLMGSLGPSLADVVSFPSPHVGRATAGAAVTGGERRRGGAVKVAATAPPLRGGHERNAASAATRNEIAAKSNAQRAFGTSRTVGMGSSGVSGESHDDSDSHSHSDSHSDLDGHGPIIDHDDDDDDDHGDDDGLGPLQALPRAATDASQLATPGAASDAIARATHMAAHHSHTHSADHNQVAVSPSRSTSGLGKVVKGGFVFLRNDKFIAELEAPRQPRYWVARVIAVIDSAQHRSLVKRNPTPAIRVIAQLVPRSTSTHAALQWLYETDAGTNTFVESPRVFYEPLGKLRLVPGGMRCVLWCFSQHTAPR